MERMLRLHHGGGQRYEAHVGEYDTVVFYETETGIDVYVRPGGSPIPGEPEPAPAPEPPPVRVMTPVPAPKKRVAAKKSAAKRTATKKK